jgi:hypothetical protein
MEEPVEYEVMEAANHSKPQLQEALGRLSHDQMRYVLARLRTSSKKAAAADVGIPYDTVCHWPAYVDEAVDLLLLDTIAAAKALMVQGVAQAMAVKLAGLESLSEKVRQGVSTELIEWNLGRAPLAIALTHGATEEMRQLMRELVGLGEDDD